MDRQFLLKIVDGNLHLSRDKFRDLNMRTNNVLLMACQELLEKPYEARIEISFSKYMDSEAFLTSEEEAKTRFKEGLSNLLRLRVSRISKKEILGQFPVIWGWYWQESTKGALILFTESAATELRRTVSKLMFENEK